MGTVVQTVLPFKLEATEEGLTANAGLALFCEFVHGLGISRWLAQEMPQPGSGRGDKADAYVTPLILMFTGGGRSLEDLRLLKNDRALAALLKREQGYSHLTETLHRMSETKKAFRLIIVKHKHQGELFDDKPRYHVIASHRVESTEATLIWYRQRGEVSENGIKALKIGFGMERMPCGQFKANAAFFRIGVIAHNLFLLFRHSALDADWGRCQVAAVRWRLFHLPGKLVRHAGVGVLKVAAEAIDLFSAIRARSFRLAQAMSP